MKQATVTLPGEKPKTVKNLGWLLAHWNQVDRLAFVWAPSKETVCDGKLVVTLRGGTVYETDFASLSVCWRWLNRPVFIGNHFRLTDAASGKSADFIIGNSAWRRIQDIGDSGLPGTLARFERETVGAAKAGERCCGCGNWYAYGACPDCRAQLPESGRI